MDMKLWAGCLVIGLTLVTTTRAAAQLDAGLPIGTTAPIVSIGDLDGKPVDLGTLIGKKPVLLEFWASWCDVCKSLLPELNRVQAKFGSRITMVGVNITVNESKERVRRYLAVHKPPFLPLYDEKGVGSRAFDVPTTGFIVIVDAKGKVAYTGSGEDQDLVAAVTKVLAK